MKFDEFVATYASRLGSYQKLQFVLVILPTLFCAFHSLSWTFIAPNLAHRCRLESELDVEQPAYDIGQTPLIKGCEDKEDCVYESCSLADGQYCPNGFVYKDYSRYTAVERWDLVCNGHILKPVVQSAYYLGQFIGSSVFGFLGDRIGRQKVLLSAIFIQFVSGVCMALSPTWWIYATARAFTGAAHSGIFMTAVVLGMELVGPKYRSLASVFAGAFFSVGQIILGSIAYFVSDYRALQLAITLPTIFMLPYICIIPESTRWLLSQKEYKKADKLMRELAIQSNNELPTEWWSMIDTETVPDGEKQEKKHYGDLLKTPKVRARTLVLFFCWPVVSMAYYGMSMKPDLLGNNPYVNFIAGGMFEIPASLFMLFTVDRLGRRPLLIGGLIVAGITLLSNTVLTAETLSFIPTIQFLVSKASMTLVYSTIYAYTPELFPTEIRNMAVGGCSMIARFGASSASFMVMYLVEVYGRNVITIPFGSLVIAAAILIRLTLPETMGTALPETIRELESGGSTAQAATKKEIKPLVQEKEDSL